MLTLDNHSVVKTSLLTLFQEFWNIPDVLVCLLRDPRPPYVGLCIEHGRLYFGKGLHSNRINIIETNLSTRTLCVYTCSTIVLALITWDPASFLPVSNLVDTTIKYIPPESIDTESKVMRLKDIIEKICKGDTKIHIGSRFS